MNQTELTTLQAAILADPALATFVANGQDNAIAAYYNEPANPVVLAWKETYSVDDMFDKTNLVEYIARSNAERQAYDLLMTRGSIDPSKNKIRKAIEDIFSGPTNSTSRTAILEDMTENCTRAQALFGGNSATSDTVTAIKRNFIGLVTDSDVAKALRG